VDDCIGGSIWLRIYGILKVQITEKSHSGCLNLFQMMINYIVKLQMVYF
jgi:hypothetical protein